MGRNRLAIVLAFSLVALQSAAVTIHRSFRTREAGFGFGTGTAGVAYPVDAKIDKAIDEARQKEAWPLGGRVPDQPLRMAEEQEEDVSYAFGRT